jgi:hypothetical protein
MSNEDNILATLHQLAETMTAAAKCFDLCVQLRKEGDHANSHTFGKQAQCQLRLFNALQTRLDELVAAKKTVPTETWERSGDWWKN